MSGERTTLQTPIGARLRAETRHQHAAVESTLAFLVPDVRPAAYRAFLARWHGFHRVAEPRLDAWHVRARLLDWPPRRKLRLLEDDLRALGVGREQVRRLPVCPDVPAVGGTATALGVLYVVEGSTLGGAVLRRRLAGGRIPPTPSVSCRPTATTSADAGAATARRPHAGSTSTPRTGTGWSPPRAGPSTS